MTEDRFSVAPIAWGLVIGAGGGVTIGATIGAVAGDVPRWIAIGSGVGPMIGLAVGTALGFVLAPGPPPGECPACGYDIRATGSRRCPECGASLGRVATPPAAHDGRDPADGA